MPQFKGDIHKRARTFYVIGINRKRIPAMENGTLPTEVAVGKATELFYYELFSFLRRGSFYLGYIHQPRCLPAKRSL